MYLLRRMNFVRNARVALFFSSINLTKKLDLASSLKTSISALDGDPLIMPIPDDAPSDIPRIILTSKNKEYSLNLSPKRVDFFYNNLSSKSTTYDNFTKEMIKTIKIIDETLRTNHSATINRLGLIVDFELDKKNAIRYAKDFFNKSFVFKDNLLEEQIHLLNREIKEGFRFNNWIRIIAQTHNEKMPKVIISNDINTLVREDKTFSNVEVNKFYTQMLKYVTENITPYV